MNPSSMTVNELQHALRSANPPILIDVRRAAVFDQAASLIAGAHWQNPEAVDAWSSALTHSTPVVVYCVHGHEVSQNCASKLLAQGLTAHFLVGGITAWELLGGALALKQ